MSHTRRTKFLSRLGAVLGLLATLWATLVGQTVPQLLESHTPPLVAFHASSKRICSKLPQDAGYISPPGPGGQNLIRDARTFKYQGATALADQFVKNTYDPLDVAIRALFTVVAPVAYQQTFNSFKNELATVDQDLLSLSGSIYGVYIPPVRKNVLLTLGSIRRSYNDVLAALQSGDLMNLDQCTGALAGVTDALQRLSDAIAPPP